MLAIVVVLVLLTAGVYAYGRLIRGATPPESLNSSWEAAISNNRSQVGQILLKVSRPLSNIPSIYQAGESPQYKLLQNKILASGTFGNSVEVFLATQAMVTFLSLVGMVGLLVGGVHGMPLLASTVLAVAFAALPWNLVSKKAKDRSNAVAQALPEFAELLLMPLESGMTVMSALSFTAERLSGPVAEEVQNLRTVINSRAMPEAQAFQFAAARLGTPEATAFFTALMQAHLEGAKLIRNLQAQALALRDAAHQRARADAKKLPVKLVIIFAIHLLPVLFVVALLPTFFSLGNI